MMKNIGNCLELLSPARDLISGKAAIDHGADAVYIGASRFGARAAVGNSVADIAELCDYAHLFGAKVYVTVNTIVYDEELEEAAQLLHELKAAGVDAVLVQDMAVMQMALDEGLTVHASTQTDNRTVEKVRWLYEQGCSRVVLARELSLEEIAAIHKAVPEVELEVFVHGALCVSYSGRCYASQFCFNRSANRGECSQFCRMSFTLEDAEGKALVRDRYLLSLRDMSRIDYLRQLAVAGVVSFKIEGRLKDIAYVKNITAAYSQALNKVVGSREQGVGNRGAFCRLSHGVVRYFFTPDINRTFTRGYTPYFIKGRDMQQCSLFTPKSIGDFVGNVKEVGRNFIIVASTKAFANGDGLCFFDAEGAMHGFRINRVEGNRLYLLSVDKTLKKGAKLYRNNDIAFENELKGKTAERRIPISMKLEKTETGYRLSAKSLKSLDMIDNADIVDKGKKLDNLVSIDFTCEHQAAQNPQRENIIRQLSKLGNTPYILYSADVDGVEGMFIPSSLLSEMRRKITLTPALSLKGEGVFRDTSSTKSNKNAPSPFRERAGVRVISAQPHFLNISNHAAANFYLNQGMVKTATPSAFELQEKHAVGEVIMQCRYCIRHELGICKRDKEGQRIVDPLFLKLSDGRRFRLQFDCKNCEMSVLTT